METFPHLGKETDARAREAQRVPRKTNPQAPTPGHLLPKTPKVRDRENLRSKRKAGSYLQGVPSPKAESCQLTSAQTLCRPEGLARGSQ